MPKDDTRTTSIALDQAEVTLIAGVLDRAAADCRAAAPPETCAEHDIGVTLGRLTALWTEIAVHERHCDVVNLHGERLFSVQLTAESWYQVRAALAACVAQLAVEPGNAADQDRMARALRLAEKIDGATHGR
ncbi:hypothetical protein [Streptomyces yangpuensis]|uniref:hypothetical protein n=1 Tax=Streptomyces yangpuensis TaxID=1648182 RepID=UPI00365C1E2D